MTKDKFLSVPGFPHLQMKVTEHIPTSQGCCEDPASYVCRWMLPGTLDGTLVIPPTASSTKRKSGHMRTAGMKAVWGGGILLLFLLGRKRLCLPGGTTYSSAAGQPDSRKHVGPGPGFKSRLLPDPHPLHFYKGAVTPRRQGGFRGLK